ncbi:NADH pyrophosphatase [Kordiimonas sediminis]|uniref:NAD(+) diphosphatase n=1 Tax=Kordiimonas sediminis TaxID=1735581 RepID=A0A919AJS5_9PROT|nr:NAD(+) diphosphatase [Kordiimonas sediminis]GHF12005.1 NADH pyrophosphatase [Kordiimonas sediminis]
MTLSAIQTVFSGNPLDRADTLRPEPTLLTDWANRDDARCMVFAGDRILTGPDVGEIIWLTASQMRFLPVALKIFLGLDGAAPRYAARLAGSAEDFDGMFDHNRFRDARSIATKRGMAEPELGIIAQAKSILDWHVSHRHCSKCGHESALVKGGYERECPDCGAQHFPRTDPVVIMLALSNDRALVGRGYQWPEGLYSALAGYVEPGETIEEAVARELMEETNIHSCNVRYICSQPWPWPSSLMIGCIADATTTEITRDETEIEDARWVTKQEAIKALQKGSGDETVDSDIFMPPPVAIAHTLIRHWVEHY